MPILDKDLLIYIKKGGLRVKIEKLDYRKESSPRNKKASQNHATAEGLMSLSEKELFIK